MGSTKTTDIGLNLATMFLLLPKPLQQLFYLAPQLLPLLLSLVKEHLPKKTVLNQEVNWARRRGFLRDCSFTRASFLAASCLLNCSTTNLFSSFILGGRVSAINWLQARSSRYQEFLQRKSRARKLQINEGKQKAHQTLAKSSTFYSDLLDTRLKTRSFKASVFPLITGPYHRVP